MKIKNIFSVLALVLAAACNEATFDVKDPMVTTSTAFIVREDAAAGSETFELNANLPWQVVVSPVSAEDQVADIKVTPSSGQASLRPVTLTVTFKTNKDLKRQAVISIVTNATGASVRFTQPGESDPTEVKGSLETPYKPNDLVADLKAGKTFTENIYIRGLVSKLGSIDVAQYHNATFWLTDDGEQPADDNDAFQAFRVKDFGLADITNANIVKLKDVVTVYGPVTVYNDKVYETQANKAQILAVNGLGTASGEGTSQSPYNIGKAVATASALPEGSSTEEVYIRGVVSKIKSFSESYGDMTYYLTDDGSHVLEDAKYMQVYNGKSFGGTKFSSIEDLKIGDLVVIKGTLTNYKGNTPEVNKGSQLMELNGKTGNGE